jgi:molybdopterin-containing oxidoreductase family membrane subunit
MWWMGLVYPPYILFLAACYWLLAREELTRIASESVGLKAKIYRLLALEGLKAYIYRILPLEKLEAWIYRLLPLKRMGLTFDSDGADVRWARIIGTLALISGLLAYTVESTLFAHTEARPFWYGGLSPVDFFLGACLCGVAWILSAEIITYRVKREEIPERLKELFYEMAEILALILSVEFLLIAYKMGHGLFEPAKAQIIMLFLTGPFSQAFWLFEIAIGIVLPIVILLYAARQKKITGVAVASVMVLIGYFVKRYDFVIAAQVYPVIKKGLPSYLPALVEVHVVGGILGALLLTYTLGEKFLPLKEERHH